MSKRTYVHQKASKWAPVPRLADQPFRALPKKSRQQGRRTVNPLQFKTLYNGKEVHRHRDDDDSDDEGYGVPRRRSSRNRHEESDRKRARNSRIREIVGSDPEADSPESPPRKYYSSYKPSGYARQRVADKIAALTRSSTSTSFEDDLVALKVRLRVITKGIEEAEQLRKPGWTQEVRHLEKLRDDLMKQKEDLIEKIVEQEVEEERRKARREGVGHHPNARHRQEESPAHAPRYERERERNEKGAAREYTDRRGERRVDVEERVYAERRVVREVEERREPPQAHQGHRNYDGTVKAPEVLRKPAGYSSEDSTSSTSIGRATGDEMRQRILLAEQKAAELRRGLAQRASQQSQHERESRLNEETVDARRVQADVRTHDAAPVSVAVPLNRQRISQTTQIQESPADAFRTPRAAPPIRVQTQNLETRRVVDGNNPLGTVDETVPGSYTGTATFPFAHAAMARRTVSNFPRLRLSEAAKATGYMESCVRIIGKKVRKARESAMVPGEQTTRGEGDEWGREQGEGQTEQPHSVLSLLSGADNVTSIFHRTSSRDGEEKALREENIFGDDDHVAMEALRDCQAGVFENHAVNGDHNLTQSSGGNMESAWNGPEWTAPATPPLERMFNRTVHTMDRDMIDRNQRDFRGGVAAAVAPSQSTPTLQTSKLTSVGPGFSTILFADMDQNSTHQQCVPVHPTDDRMSWIEEDKGIGERVPRFEREEEMMEEPADDNDDCSSGYPPSASDGSSRGFSSSKSQSFHFDMSFSGTDIPFETDAVQPAGRTGNNNVQSHQQQSRPTVTSRRDHRVDESMAFLRQPPLMSQSQIQMSQSQMSQMGTQQMSQMQQQRQGPFDWFNKYTIDEESVVGRVVQQEEEDDDESVFRM